MLAGLCIGLVLVAGLEYRDASVKTEDEVRQVFGLPVLAVVPVMRSTQEKRSRRRRVFAVHLCLASVVLGSLSVLAYTIVR
jgi:hypothetical protein